MEHRRKGGDECISVEPKRRHPVGFRRLYDDGREVTTTYTDDGNRETVTDARGVTAYEYGLCCSRLSSVTNPDGSWIEYEYDAQGNKTEMRTPWDTTLYTFDVLNRMKTVQSLGEVAVTEYFYNAVGNRDSLAHSNGTSVGYTPKEDRMGKQLRSISRT